MTKNANVSAMFYLWVFFIVIGIVCLVAGVRNYIHEEAIFAKAEQDTATLTKYVPDPNYNTADFCPQFEFTTQAGQPISYVGDSCVSQPDSSKIGQTEQVYIDPKVPQVIESRGWTGSEGSGLILGIVGFLFFPLLGLSIYLSTLFSERKKAISIKRKPVAASSADLELAQLELEEEKLRTEIKKRRGQ